MPRHFHDFRDLVIASGILLIALAGKADGQVAVAFVEKGEPPDPRSAIVALERSRESLLQAREAIDAALLEVDRALLAVKRPRGAPEGVARARARRVTPAPIALLLAAGAGAKEAFQAGLGRSLPPLWSSMKEALASLCVEEGAGSAPAGWAAAPAPGAAAGAAPESLPLAAAAAAAISAEAAREKQSGAGPLELPVPEAECATPAAATLRFTDLREAARLFGLDIEPATGRAPPDRKP